MRFVACLGLTSVLLCGFGGSADTASKPEATVTVSVPWDAPAFAGAAQQEIERVYDKAQELVAVSDRDLKFELSNFHMVQREEFGDFNLLDVVTVLPDKRIQVQGTAGGLLLDLDSDRPRSVHGVYYDAQWLGNENSQLPNVVMMNYGDFFEQYFETGYGFPKTDVLGLTRYQVAVTLDGVQEVYTAAMLWLRPEVRSKPLRGYIEDAVTSGLDVVVREDRQILRKKDVEDNVQELRRRANNPAPATHNIIGAPDLGGILL